MDMQRKVKKMIEEIKKIRAGENGIRNTENVLPSGCYFLNEDEILCRERKFGDSRYPYSCDGLTLWAYSSGNIKIEESTFNVILDFPEGKNPNVCFYAGRKTEEGYFPVSITGMGKLPFEKGVSRHTVYTPDAVYYITETAEFVACVRMFVDNEKNVRFTLYIENATGKPIETYLSAYFNCMLSHGNYEFIETKWFRSSKATEDGFAISVTECLDRATCFENKATLFRERKGQRVYSTTSHTDYCGGMHNTLCCSTALQKGVFEENKTYTEFTDTAIAGDILPLQLRGKEGFVISYTLTLSEQGARETSTEEIDRKLYAEKDQNAVGQKIPKVSFDGEWNGVKSRVLNAFMKNVFRQTEFCARAKNYAGPYIGIRDIFQQLEAALVWIPEYCRGKIVEALNFIGENGRAPRQYSYPKNPKVLPAMDLRLFVDQGVWIISTVYTYLCYTGDWSILEEECGYYKFDGNTVGFSLERDSVLEHLIRIVEYLISNLDEETDCLHALYGDWNDALDGLGKTEDRNKEYGTGVSVMATLQLYRNLGELEAILRRLDRENEGDRYAFIRKKVENGLKRYAVVENEKGDRKILHGWGDKREYFVGSFCDNDGKNRDGLTSNAYWVLSGMLEQDVSLKADILSAYERLDSKYGLKTFEPYFDKTNDKVGRINRLPKGTAENGATYIHATLFGIWSLFEMGEPERAWEQLYKILPITHESISTTPFVMPNSYVYNEEKGFDGESMSDWFTGSGCVLLKVLFGSIFGVKPDLNGVRIRMSSYIPFKKAKIRLKIKGCNFALAYHNVGKGSREYRVNGNVCENAKEGVYFSSENLQSDITVEIFD